MTCSFIFVGCPNGTNFKEIQCKEKACTIQTCPNYPQAQCMYVYVYYLLVHYYELTMLFAFFANKSMNNI